MLTGRKAFKRDTPVETMTAILKDPIPEMDLSGTDLSSDLDRIVGRCLEKNPEERFQSASDLAFSLRETAKPGAHPASIPPAPRRGIRIAGAVFAVLFVTAAAVFLWRSGILVRKSGPAGPSEGKRVAVLPFENLGSGDDAYFAAGVTDEITGRLASVQGLVVVSRTCAALYAGSTKSPRQIGDELSVQYLLTGTVRWARGPDAAERVRITPELIRVDDNTSLWTEIFEFSMNDIFGVQSQIARSVVSQLGLTLLEHKPGMSEERPTGNMEAYQAFLRGRFLAGQPHFTLSTWLSAVDDFERAVDLDPGFALAWSYLSRAHARLVYYRHDITPERSGLARHALDQADRLAPESAEVHLAAGYYHLWVERDTEAARTEFEAASKGMPNSVEIQAALGELFRMHGEWERGLEAYKSAATLSPRDGSAMVDVAETLWWMRRYPEAAEAANRAIALSPDQAWPYLSKAFNLWSWKGRDGLAEARSALEFLPKDHEWTEMCWFWQESSEGRFAEAIRRMEADPEGWIRLKVQAAPKVLLAATLRASLGETEKAREKFETALRLLEAEVQARPRNALYRSSLGVAYAGLGRREEAVREGRLGVELLPMSKDAVYGIPGVLELAQIYTILGDAERAVEQLEYLLSQPGWISVPYLRMDYRFPALQGDPRFEALLAKHETTLAARPGNSMTSPISVSTGTTKASGKPK